MITIGEANYYLLLTMIFVVFVVFVLICIEYIIPFIINSLPHFLIQFGCKNEVLGCYQHS